MKKFRMLVMALLCAVTVGVTGCKEGTDSVTEDFGVRITLPGKSDRAVFYDAIEVTTYHIKVTQNDYTAAEKTAAPGDTVTITLEDLGDYEITVTGKDENSKEIARGRVSVSFAEGDGYKDVVIDIEPEEKNIGIHATAVWEAEKEGYFTSSDAVRYDVTIYENGEVFAEYEDVNVLNENYQIDIPWYSTYKIKIEAIKENLDVIGSGEAEFTLTKGDTFKDVTVIIEAARKDAGEVLPAEVFGVNASMNWVEGYRREKVQFGEWPQSLSDITGLTLTATGKNYDGHTEYSADDGNKYVEVNESYYKVEPMTWRVIAYNSDGSKKLLADKIYTNLVFYGIWDGRRSIGSKTIYPNNYKYSNVRAYLNSINNQFVTDGGTATTYDIDWTDAGFFTSAFNDEEKAKIKETVVDKSVASTGYNPNSYACENTVDKIYLLSYAEATKKLYGFTNDEDRIMKTTEYARANGAYQSSTEGYGGYWWLRSPRNDYSDRARGIYYFGDPDRYDIVHYGGGGVVPALSVTE